MIWLILQWSAVYNCFNTSMTFFRVPYFSAIFPWFFFNFSYKYKLKSRLLEIPFLIPALYSEMQRTNVSSPWWHSFVPLIFPGTHSPIFFDYTSPECHVIFLFWQNFHWKDLLSEALEELYPIVNLNIKLFYNRNVLIYTSPQKWQMSGLALSRVHLHCLRGPWQQEFSMSLPPKTFLL